MLHSVFLLSLLSSTAFAELSKSNLKTYVGSLELSTPFSPIKDDYRTGLPHHHRTPFAVSPDGKSAYLAYLGASGKGVHVQKVDPVTFKAVGDAVTVSCAKEAGGLVAHNDGFALLTNEPMDAGTQKAPPKGDPVAVIYRWTRGKRAFKTFLGGPDNVGEAGAVCSPYLNGDLAYSEDTGMYGAYFVVTSYDGPAQGHFGDSIQYINDNGTIQKIEGATKNWGCSFNTGIALAASASAPFASVCADDQGGIWLNTGGTGMDKTGVKVSNEYARNGASNEPMGGVSGSYSSLTRFINKDSYIFTWVSRGSKDLTENKQLGEGYTTSSYRTKNRNVAIATFSDKKTLVGKQATNQPGPDGDSQVNWITTGSSDCQNAHVAAFDGSNALVTWEEIAEPTCNFPAMGCQGEFSGTYFQLVKDGKKVGEPIKSMDVYVAGDMVTMADGRICWPYVDMSWSLNGPVADRKTTNAISFACISSCQSKASTPSDSDVPLKPSSPSKPVSSPEPAEPYQPSEPSMPAEPSKPSSPSPPPASNTPSAAPPASTPAYHNAPPVPTVSFSLFNPDSTPSPTPKPTPSPTPINDNKPRPYESVYIPASLSFDPIMAPAFTHVLPGLPGEFTNGPVYSTTETPAAPTRSAVPCSGAGGSYGGSYDGSYGGAGVYGAKGGSYGDAGAESPCTLRTVVRPSASSAASY